MITVFVNIEAKLANEIENNPFDSNSSENNFFRPDVRFFKFSEINQHVVPTVHIPVPKR